MASSTSSIHYKFGNDVVLKRLSFEGIHIPLDELKKSISQVEGINLEYVDLSLSNADTKREYEGSCFIPRNSTVILKRVPRATPIRLPKVNTADASGAVLQKTVNGPPTVNHINQEDFAKMSEEERLKHVKMISTQKYNPINFIRKHQNFQNGSVPPDFRCHRCGNLGHHPKQCLMQNVRKTTGIPSEELMDASPSDPNALLHQSGRYVIPILHYKARETRKLVDRALFEREQQLAAAANNKDKNNSSIKNLIDSKQQQLVKVPQELECPICHHLLVDALLAPCCGESFCAECIQNYMLKCSENDDGVTKCPTCPGSKPLSVNSLIPNKRIRDAVQRHKASIASTTTTKTFGAIPLAAVPVAAHEGPSSVNASPIAIYDKSPSPPSSQIIQLPTVNLTSFASPTISSPTVVMDVDVTKPPPTLRTPQSATSSPMQDNGNVDLPPGIIHPSPPSLAYNPNIPPPNISLPSTNLSNLYPTTTTTMSFNRPPMGYYCNPIGGMVSAAPPSSATTTMLWQTISNNDGPPGISTTTTTRQTSIMDMPPGTEMNHHHSSPKINARNNIYDGSGYFGNIPITLAEINKINESWDSVKSDDVQLDRKIHEKESRPTKSEKRRKSRSRSPRERSSRYDRDRKERYKNRDNDDDERKYRTSRDEEVRSHRRDKNEEKGSSRKHKEGKSEKKHKEDKSSRKNKDDGGESSSHHRHRKDKEHNESSSKHKKKSSKKDKKKKKDHDS